MILGWCFLLWGRRKRKGDSQEEAETYAKLKCWFILSHWIWGGILSIRFWILNTWEPGGGEEWQNLGPGCLVVVRVKEPAGQTQRRCAEVACPSTLACQGTLRLKEVSLLISYKVTNSRWVDCLMNEWFYFSTSFPTLADWFCYRRRGWGEVVNTSQDMFNFKTVQTNNSGQYRQPAGAWPSLWY